MFSKARSKSSKSNLYRIVSRWFWKGLCSSFFKLKTVGSYSWTYNGCFLDSFSILRLRELSALFHPSLFSKGLLLAHKVNFLILFKGVSLETSFMILWLMSKYWSPINLIMFYKLPCSLLCDSLSSIRVCRFGKLLRVLRSQFSNCK